MGLFSRKKEAPIDFFKAKAGVFLERLYNGTISRQAYEQATRRILYVEGILKVYPFYDAYIKGHVPKKTFLEDLKAFYPELLAGGISRKELYEIVHQVELNENVSFENVVKEEISFRSLGNIFIKGTILRKGEGHRNGIVLTHGISCFRYNLLNLAEILSQLGYLVLAIDLPKHNLNQEMDLTLGSIAELIRDSVIYLRRVHRIRNVAVIGHSLGAVGTLLASVGYTSRAEREIYVLWERIRKAIEEVEKRSNIYSKLRPGLENITLQDILRDEGFMGFLNEIAAYYKRIKEIIFESLKRRDELGGNFVDCCVMLAMPAECKKAFVGLSLLSKLPNKWIKRVWETLMNNSQIKLVMKEGNIFSYINENTNALKSWYLRVENPYEFINYFLNVKEPADFITLINILSGFSHKEGKVSFIEYYRRKYLLYVPKLFIYGKWDLLLRPWFGSGRKLRKTYEAYGNAQIIQGNYSHILTKKPFQQMAVVAVTSDVVMQNIITFLNKNMNSNKIF